MRSRIMTALALAVLLVGGIVYAPPVVTAIMLGLILVVGAWEWSAFLAVGPGGRWAYMLVLALLGLIAYLRPLEPARFTAVMVIGVIWWLVALAWILWAPQRVGRVAAALAGILALLPTWAALMRIDQLWARGPEWTLFVLALAFAADTGAFFAGRYFGRVHLAPRVSPNKTWEGVLGGMVLTAILGLIAAAWFNQPLWRFIPLCLLAAAFSIIGDLTESLLKRHVHLKDSGRLFPGHGGVLDRIDSVTAATPVIALSLMWLGVGA